LLRLFGIEQVAAAQATIENVNDQLIVQRAQIALDQAKLSQ
jgi:uncharacterized coiled-coil protein SlyX